jgi:phenylalanyl-tRNA synthetase beta chain
VKQNILDNFGLKKPVALFDFDFKALAKLATAVKSYQPIAEFPGVTRDLAVIIDKIISWQQVKELVSGNNLIVEVEYLSTFIDDSIGTGKKSLAFRLTFRVTDRTLKSEEVDEVIKKIVANLERNFGAKLR